MSQKQPTVISDLFTLVSDLETRVAKLEREAALVWDAEQLGNYGQVASAGAKLVEDKEAPE